MVRRGGGRVETAADGKSGRGSARGNGFRREREAREIRKFLGLPGAPHSG
jgi:hypothetical protein